MGLMGQMGPYAKSIDANGRSFCCNMTTPPFTRPIFQLHDPLDGALLKLERAKKHLRDLRAEVAAFADLNPYSVSVMVNLRPGEHAVRAHIHHDIPAGLSV